MRTRYMHMAAFHCFDVSALFRLFEGNIEKQFALFPSIQKIAHARCPRARLNFVPNQFFLCSVPRGS